MNPEVGSKAKQQGRNIQIKMVQLLEENKRTWKTFTIHDIALSDSTCCFGTLPQT
jgi:hypothetical protein